MKTETKEPFQEFKQKTINHVDCFISGNYKAVKYGEYWFAFHKPKDQRMFGDSCYYTNNNMNDSQKYTSKENAMKACQHHFNERTN